MYELINQVPQNTNNAISDLEKLTFVHLHSKAVNSTYFGWNKSSRELARCLLLRQAL